MWFAVEIRGGTIYYYIKLFTEPYFALGTWNLLLSALKEEVKSSTNTLVICTFRTQYYKQDSKVFVWKSKVKIKTQICFTCLEKQHFLILPYFMSRWI